MPFEMAKGHAMTVVDAELGMDQKFLFDSFGIWIPRRKMAVSNLEQ